MVAGASTAPMVRDERPRHGTPHRDHLLRPL